MAGRVNIGAFRNQIQVFYESGQTVSPMGSTVQVLSNYYVYADVNQIDSKQAVSLGINENVMAYSAVFRTHSTVRPVKVILAGEEMTVVSVNMDKLNRFMKLILKASN